MRLVVCLLALAVAACTVTRAVDLPTAGGGAASPFEATRGSAGPPPNETGASAQAAPPEGRGPGGIDFGRWKSADPAVYGPRFQEQMRQRFPEGTETHAARADLERNGFVCRERPNALECRIEIMENDCAKDWYVVFERARREPLAGFDIMCLGAIR
jgi:hypothetical protein